MAAAPATLERLHHPPVERVYRPTKDDPPLKVLRVLANGQQVDLTNLVVSLNTATMLEVQQHTGHTLVSDYIMAEVVIDRNMDLRPVLLNGAVIEAQIEDKWFVAPIKGVKVTEGYTMTIATGQW